MFTKAAILISAVLVFAGVAAASSLTSLGSNDSPTVTTPTLSTGAEDVSGPCDELEHANDPRCTGVPAGQAGNDDRADDRREAGEDVRGPCDEAEHASDPRCTGAAAGQTRDDDGLDDRGHNSGSGSDDSGHRGGDDSGHHQGGDDSGHRGGDDSGHGGGNSGHGGSDD